MEYICLPKDVVNEINASDILLLEALWEYEDSDNGGLRNTQLAGTVDLSKSYVSERISGLVSLGLVEKKVPDGSNQPHIFLSDDVRFLSRFDIDSYHI